MATHSQDGMSYQRNSVPKVLLILSQNGMPKDYPHQILPETSDPVSKVPQTCTSQSTISQFFSLAQSSLLMQTQLDIAKQLCKDSSSEKISLPNPVVKSNLKKIEPERSRNDHENALTKNTDTSQSEKSPMKRKNKSTFTKGCKDTGSNGNVYVCDNNKCLRTFSSPGHLRNHQNMHNKEKPLTCEAQGCQRTFTWPAHFRYHKLTHKNLRNYVCQVQGCEKKFYTAQRLRVHGRIHTGEKPYPCSVCGRSFTTAGNLNNHARTHTGVKPFECKEPGCEKRFAEYSSLKKHIVTHTGEKPYSCEKCGKRFTQCGSMKAHVKRHDLNDGGSDLEEDYDHEDESFHLKSNNKRKSKKSNVLVIRNEEEESFLSYPDLQMVLSGSLRDRVVSMTTHPSDGTQEVTNLTPIENIMTLSEGSGYDCLSDDVMGTGHCQQHTVVAENCQLDP